MILPDVICIVIQFEFFIQSAFHLTTADHAVNSVGAALRGAGVGLREPGTIAGIHASAFLNSSGLSSNSQTG